MTQLVKLYLCDDFPCNTKSRVFWKVTVCLSILVISNHRILITFFLSNTLWSFLFVINTCMLLVRGESESFYILYATYTFLCFLIYRNEKQYIFGYKNSCATLFCLPYAASQHRYHAYYAEICSNCSVNSWKCWCIGCIFIYLFHFISFTGNISHQKWRYIGIKISQKCKFFLSLFEWKI